MKANEPLSNRAYLPRRNFQSPPPLSLRPSISPPAPQLPSPRFYNESRNFQTLQRNIRNTLTMKLQGEFDHLLTETQRENNNLREQNRELKQRLAQFQSKITGLHTQLEIKKAIREGRKVDIKMLAKGQGESQEEEWGRAADVYENQIRHWRELYETELRKSEEMKVQLGKVDTELDTLVCDYLTDGQQ